MIQISPTKTIYKPSTVPVTESYKQACESDLKRYSASYTGGDDPSHTSPLDRPSTISYAGHYELYNPFSDIQSIGHPQSFQDLQRSATSCTVQNVLPSHTSSFRVYCTLAVSSDSPSTIKTGLNCVNQNRSTSSLLSRWLARCRFALFDIEHIRYRAHQISSTSEHH